MGDYSVPLEVLSRASKQVMDVEAPRHYCQESVKVVVPWVWGMRSVIVAWHLTAGRDLPQAQEMRARRAVGLGMVVTAHGPGIAKGHPRCHHSTRLGLRVSTA